MQKLMTKFDFTVTQDVDGIHTIVTRHFDGAVKHYTQVYGSLEGMTEFMNSITDDLAEGYFPRPRKNK
jgi:hypothetical protein